MSELELSTVVSALRDELETAIKAGAGEDLNFEAKEVVVEFQVGVTKSVEGKGGIKFWVVELGGGGSRATESVQKVSLKFEPIMKDGTRVKIAGGTDESPLAK